MIVAAPRRTTLFSYCQIGSCHRAQNALFVPQASGAASSQADLTHRVERTA